jgi:predicted flap endonuclease-1-like 5' DNA nuclease
MDYLVVEIWLYLVLVFAIGLVAGLLFHALRPAHSTTGDRVAVAESMAMTREGEARQLRAEVDTMRERLRIAEAEAAAAQADVSRANQQLSTTRTDTSRKIIALEEEIAALKRLKVAAPAPEPMRIVEQTPMPAPTLASSAIAAPTSVSTTASASAAPKPAPTPPAPPPVEPAAVVAEPLPLIASMEIPAAPQPSPPQPAPTLTTVAPAPAQPVELPPDDLKEIVGIGPILEHTLQSLGLRTFAQIATITPEDIAMLIVKVDSSIAERVLRERWVEQARELYAKKYGKAAA